jgi:Domain of unknown function (DUF4157)
MRPIDHLKAAQAIAALVEARSHDSTQSLVGETLGTSGTPLDEATRADMSMRFAHRLKKITIHSVGDGPAGSRRASEAVEPEAENAAREAVSTPAPTGRQAFDGTQSGTPASMLDFRGVRVHADSKAAASAQMIGAHAYTSGSHVVFAGNYSPNTDSGRRLLAHELAHVVQQAGPYGASRGRIPGAKPTLSPYLACAPAYPRIHETVLNSLIAIQKKHPKDGDERQSALEALAKTVPEQDRPLLVQRLTKPGTTDAFAVYLKNNFPASREAFLRALGAKPDEAAAEKKAPPVVPPAKATLAPQKEGAEFVSNAYADVKSNPQYLDNFTNDINEAWLPNDRVFVFQYPNNSVLKIALADLVKVLKVPSELNPQASEAELRKKYKIPEDLELPKSTSPTLFATVGGSVNFYRDKESGVIYPSGDIYQTYLPRISSAVKQIEAVRVNEELWQKIAPKLVEIVANMEWSAPQGFGALLVSIGRRLKAAGKVAGGLLKGLSRGAAPHISTPKGGVPHELPAGAVHERPPSGVHESPGAVPHEAPATPSIKINEGKAAELPDATVTGTPKPAAARPNALENVSDDTKKMLANNPKVKGALEKSPRAANALKKCRSLCFPEFTTPTQVDRIERMLETAENSRIVYDAEKLTNYLRSKNSWEELEQAVEELEKDLAKKREILGEFGEAGKRIGGDRVTPEGRTATAAQRALPGTATGGEKLPDVTDQWFPEVRDPVKAQAIAGTKDIRVAQIPGQIARKLRKMTFKNFDEFRETFWKLIANDPVLKKGWSASNLSRMQEGLAPAVAPAERVGGGANAVYQLNHKQAIKNAGDVYNLDNIEVVGPRFHGEIGD